MMVFLAKGCALRTSGPDLGNYERSEARSLACIPRCIPQAYTDVCTYDTTGIHSRAWQLHRQHKRGSQLERQLW